MIDSTVFIGAIIIAITQALKYVAPRINGLITMVTAVIVGIVVAILSIPIGLNHISIAQGILIALAAVGVHTVATNVNTNIGPKV